MGRKKTDKVVVESEKVETVEEEVQLPKTFKGTFPAQISFVLSSENKEKALVGLNNILLAMNIILKGQVQALAQPTVEEV